MGSPRPASPPVRLPDSAPADRLGAAAWVVAAAAGLVVLAVVVTAGDGIRGLARPPAATLRLYRTLGLSEPGLIPAGRRERHPAQQPAAIDWRYLPSLPQQDPGLIRPLEKERLIRATVPPP